MRRLPADEERILARLRALRSDLIAIRSSPSTAGAATGASSSFAAWSMRCAARSKSRGAMVKRNASMRRGASSNPTSPSTQVHDQTLRAAAQSDNDVYLAQRERIIEGMRLAAVPEG